ncbi:autotransporter outer membrane beta-barrel domain-containing protein [Escherichia coli]|uniref:autotransporter outer membrane beta-barrel domain-containing protein n=1 Tax=Escherichia coli TaxID=562 RepID=UPI002036DFE9
MMFPNMKMAWIITTHRGLSLAGSRVSVVTGHGVVIEPQAQVIYQGVQQDDFTAATMRACHNHRAMIFSAAGFTSEWRTAVHVTPH